MKRCNGWMVLAAVVGMGVGSAWGQQKDPVAVPDGAVGVETRTYNVADLVRTTPDYPFVSAVRPASGLGREGVFGQQGGGGQTVFAPAAGQAEGKGKKGGEVEMGLEGLVEVIQSNIEPESWRDAGGTIGSVQPLGSLLVVTQTSAAHQRIEGLLGMIRKEYGPLKTVSVRVKWVAVEPDQLGLLDGEGLAKLPAEVVWAEGRTSCFSGQTVYVASGRGRTAVSRAMPIVGTQIGLYEVQSELVQSGAVLQVTPLLSPDGKTAVLDVASVASDWGKPEGTIEVTGSVAGPGAPTTRPAVKVDRLNVGVQEMRTTVRVPVGKAVVVGGMTGEPGTEEKRQMYLVAEVRGE